MTPFLSVIDQSAQRAERELSAIRANPHSAKDESPIVVVHTETLDAAQAVKECFAVNGISYVGEPHGERMSFEVSPFLYQDCKKALIANLPQLRERSSWRNYVLYFSVRERMTA